MQRWVASWESQETESVGRQADLKAAQLAVSKGHLQVLHWVECWAECWAGQLVSQWVAYWVGMLVVHLAVMASLWVDRSARMKADATAGPTDYR